MTVQAKTVVDSFREALQDLPVPELKSMRVSIDSVRAEMQLRDENLRTELKLRDEALRSQMQALRSETQAANNSTQESIRNLSSKLDYTIEVRERLAALEARLPRQ